jgi:chromosome segregation ATPase
MIYSAPLDKALHSLESALLSEPDDLDVSDWAVPPKPMAMLEAELRDTQAEKAAAWRVADSRQAALEKAQADLAAMKSAHDRLAKHIELAADQYINDLAMLKGNYKADLAAANARADAKEAEAGALRAELARIADALSGDVYDLGTHTIESARDMARAALGAKGGSGG